MSVSRMVAMVAALTAPFLLPAGLAFVVVLGAAVVLPPLGLIVGVLSDALYYTPAVHVPYATLGGLAISVIGLIVHRFIKTRIMG